MTVLFETEILPTLQIYNTPQYRLTLFAVFHALTVSMAMMTGWNFRALTQNFWEAKGLFNLEQPWSQHYEVQIKAAVAELQKTQDTKMPLHKELYTKECKTALFNTE